MLRGTQLVRKINAAVCEIQKFVAVFRRSYQWSLTSTSFIQSSPLRSGPGSVVAIATGYGLDGPGIETTVGSRFSALVQTGPGDHPASCTMGSGSLPGVKSDRGVTLTPHLLLVPWSWKGRAIPLLLLWAVRLVQNVSACTRVHFTKLYPYVPSRWAVGPTQPSVQWVTGLFPGGKAAGAWR
jgi:hypothetical protein